MLTLLVFGSHSRQAKPDVHWGAFFPARFTRILVGPDGGAVWQGVIKNRGLPRLRRPSLIYVPPRFEPMRRYPVIYLLHGMPGSPYSFVKGLHLARVADRLIVRRELQPVIIVMPVAGKNGHYDGEWTSVWESFVVADVVSWVDAHLPTIPLARSRTLAGMSAGGYGAVDIALRHPSLFGKIESWSGYFHPLRDGSLAHAGPRQLAAHDPSLLIDRLGPRLHRFRVRFFLSSGTTADHKLADQARAFSRRLERFRIPVTLLLRPGGHTHRFWSAQLPNALRFAVPARHPRCSEGRMTLGLGCAESP